MGSVNPDLAELCLGHEGYLSNSYVRLDVLKEYEKVEHLLSLTSNAGMNSRVKQLERDNADLKQRLELLEAGRQFLQAPKDSGARGIIKMALTPEELKAMVANIILEQMATER